MSGQETAYSAACYSWVMKPLASTRIFLLALPMAMVVAFTGAPAQAQSSSYQLVWADEFEGSTLDTTKWSPMIGNGCPNLCGWGNNELQYYRAENATVGGGHLTITARRENFGGNQYTSARLQSRNLADFTYGRFEMSAKLPAGQGMWPAFWLLPTDSVYGVWAASGEMDVMEALGQTPNSVLGTIHYGGTFPNNTFSGGNYTLPTGSFTNSFHTFAMEWEPNAIRWYVDGILYSTKTNWWSSGAPYPAPFNERFHMLLNLAVGGNLPGPPNGSTPFPATYEIDWVRVYQLEEHAPADCVCTFDDMEHGNPAGADYFAFNGGGVGGIGANLTDLPPAQGGAASLEAGWGNGGTPGYLGGFGRTNPLNLDGATHFEMWIRPDAGQSFVMEINLQDDDNGDNIIPQSPDGADDEFQYELVVSPNGPGAISGGGWQKVSIPLSSFVDDNTFLTGGNGVLDPVPTVAGGNGQLINVVMSLVSTGGSNVTFRTDLWQFTRRTSSASGLVWNDVNQDGESSGEPGLPGVTVELFDPVLGEIVATDTTSAAGTYSLAGQVLGDYEVRVLASSLPGGLAPTSDPDGTNTPDVAALALECDETLSDFDFGYGPPIIGSKICTPAVDNSTGFFGRLSASGSASIGSNNLRLTGSMLPVGSLGYFIASRVPGFIQGPGGSFGNLCVLPPIGRYLAFAGPVAPDGTFSMDVDATAIPQPTSTAIAQPGETWYFQFWHRDAVLGLATSNFTAGLRIVFE